MNRKNKIAWWEKDGGLKFKCQGSGKCCLSRGEYGYVYLTLEDRRRMAELLNLPTARFTKRFCNTEDGLYYLKSDTEACIFLKNKRCEVYQARPTQCRTWPFWPENMAPKKWSLDVAAFCPGVGKGKKVSPESISAQLTEQKNADSLLREQAIRKIKNQYK